MLRCGKSKILLQSTFNLFMAGTSVPVFLGEYMREFIDRVASYRPFLDLILQMFFWLVLIVATLTKDFENMAIAAWWIIFLELVQVNANLKSLKDNW